ncbi:MAG: histidine phosphatase family protein, partial [Alphaproteobacteria bacterium]|nr:histidine phosphatase family protein [Alphaproteobacteria bacterium]
MKTLLLLRHAKSDWGDPAREDFDRPLNARGRKAARGMAGHIARRGLGPDLVWCSTAARARETWALMATALAPGIGAAWRDDLNLATARDLLAIARRAPARA